MTLTQRCYSRAAVILLHTRWQRLEYSGACFQTRAHL